MKKVVVIISVLLMLGGLGCAALSEFLTPAEIDGGAVKYVVDAGVADTNDYTGYPNLLKANRLVKDIDAAHVLNKQELEQAIQRDDTAHSILYGRAYTNQQTSIQREGMLFGETGLLSLGMSMLGAGGFAGFLGLMRRRPGDISKEEYESAMASAGGKTREELTVKQKQFAQLVWGVQEFMDTWETANPEVVEGMKIVMDKNQDVDTQIAVATVKKS